MRATELIGMDVVDDRGRVVGQVLDALYAENAFAITALLVGSGRRARLAAATGAAQGRLAGPAVLRRQLSRAQIHRVGVDEVAAWGPDRIALVASAGRR